jgi:hypothetical protein
MKKEGENELEQVGQIKEIRKEYKKNEGRR